MTSEDIREMLEAATPELLPCPFCGGAMVWNAAGGYARHRAEPDGCPIHNQGFTDVAAWNTRDDLAAEVLRLREQAAFRDEADTLIANTRNAELDALRAEVERLREALLALADEYADPTLESEGPAYRAARAALGDSHD